MALPLIPDDVCEICKEASKTSGHVLWSCPKAHEAWEYLKVAVNIGKVEGTSFMDLMWPVLMVDGREAESHKSWGGHY